MEQDSFHRLYEAHAKDIYRFALYLSGNPAEAEEITMAAFFRAWTGEPVRDTTARAYLLSIARNLYLDERRRAARHEPVEDTHMTSANQHAQAELQQTMAALRQLPEEYGRPLELWAAGGLSYDEIAAELGLSVPVVKVRIHRARQKLAQRLGR
jgi:RNA polymerase sigma-70 factor (ECF subfamily)